MRFAVALAGAVLLAGCVSPRIPEVEPAGSIALPPDYFADARPPAGPDEAWWRGFREDELDALVAEALARNQTLDAARARLAEARALLRAQQADFLPTVDGEAALGGSIDDGGGFLDETSAGLGGVWVIDLNGRLSAERAEALAEVEASDYFLADRRRLLASAVSNRFVELRRTGARLRLLDESADLQRQTLRIVKLREEAGLSSNFDVRRAAADLSRTLAQRGPLLLARARAANALSVLTGEPPAAVPEADGRDEIPDYARGPGVGVPADLLRARPDLLLAEADIAGAAARVGVERADLLPALRLPGFVTLGDDSVNGLFSQAVAGLAGVLDVPILDGGRRRAEVEAAEAALGAALADYRQALLESLAEVESALVAIRSAEDRRDELASAVEESEAAFEQSNALYREGLASLFDVLDVQRQLIGSREALIDAEAALAQAYIDLFTAVGAPTETV
ncbi:TolC family protein [Erythrobacter sp. HL-111]|uniref:TolC family protein n=1 Tax=Erythrobacter sp. HL-111 TaxID=1798193 RepID=UPI0006DA9EB0|nr:TolC family protein [Erythrobacter sp. HL-111]KPP91128.1 MAG: RND efflux system outer membrane lipoprotein secretin component [Erythrobacteraceae bacterium HL-111]SDS46954.1 efflux transporter, outer membrane factor (OMF) lipoprotein, NodT family [Erythrobacter sp. HL-111]